MLGFLYAAITLLGWGPWLTPSQKVVFPSQQIKTLYVVATNLVIATVIALWQGSVWELDATTFWLNFLGGVIWAGGGLCAFTGTNKLGMVKALGIWTPLNIMVSLAWGALLFHEFVDLNGTTILLLIGATLAILVGVWLVIFANRTAGVLARMRAGHSPALHAHLPRRNGAVPGGASVRRTPVQVSLRSKDDLERGAFRLGLAGAVGAGILWGSYFIPIKYSAVSPWAGTFPLALGMAVGGTVLALLSRRSWRLASPGDYLRVCLTGALWSMGNYGMLLLVGVIGAGKGFTISQLSIVINALIGIYWLHEPPPGTRAAQQTFAGCILATLGGIVLGNL